MNWNEYVLRRRLDPKKWLESRSIITIDQFLLSLTEMKIEPPSQDELESMFLEQPVIIPESRNEPSSVITAAGRDQAASRVMADEKDKHDIHPNGKRNSKIRD